MCHLKETGVPDVLWQKPDDERIGSKENGNSENIFIILKKTRNILPRKGGEIRDTQGMIRKTMVSI